MSFSQLLLLGASLKVLFVETISCLYTLMKVILQLFFVPYYFPLQTSSINQDITASRLLWVFPPSKYRLYLALLKRYLRNEEVSFLFAIQTSYILLDSSNLCSIFLSFKSSKYAFLCASGRTGYREQHYFKMCPCVLFALAVKVVKWRD